MVIIYLVPYYLRFFWLKMKLLFEQFQLIMELHPQHLQLQKRSKHLFFKFKFYQLLFFYLFY
jgi:hypothetical protein